MEGRRVRQLRQVHGARDLRAEPERRRSDLDHPSDDPLPALGGAGVGPVAPGAQPAVAHLDGGGEDRHLHRGEEPPQVARRPHALDRIVQTQSRHQTTAIGQRRPARLGQLDPVDTERGDERVDAPDQRDLRGKDVHLVVVGQVAGWQRERLLVEGILVGIQIVEIHPVDVEIEVDVGRRS